VSELVHDRSAGSVSTGAPGRGRRPSRPTRAVVLLTMLVVTAGCTPSTTAASTTASTTTASSTAASSTAAFPSSVAGGATGSAAATAPGGGVVVSEDPDHNVAQPFPAQGTCRDRAVPNGTLPDPGCTPGAVDPHVTQATISTTICRQGGYTSTVRPPASVTGAEKKSALRAYNDTGPSSGYELDHLVSLELGGSPNSPRNLWPEPGAAPNPKDKVETALHDLVCANRMTLVDAQNMIAADWVSAYRQVLGTAPPVP
jgi:hypothetical protein